MTICDDVMATSAVQYESMMQAAFWVTIDDL